MGRRGICVGCSAGWARRCCLLDGLVRLELRVDGWRGLRKACWALSFLTMLVLVVLAACGEDSRTVVPDGGAGAPAATDEPIGGGGDGVGATLEPAESRATGGDDRVEVAAPVDGVEIVIAESYPPQYFAEVESGLPSGCDEYHEYEVTPTGTAINIEVTNLRPDPSSGVG